MRDFEIGDLRCSRCVLGGASHAGNFCRCEGESPLNQWLKSAAFYPFSPCVNILILQRNTEGERAGLAAR